ncbi:MAG: carboxypeptidase regulatory-like domain-containing protein [Alphaproteobacteria bacterium]|nr:carboxypeptidase regulatory-like domain-containing protein [Alphaproteobacteria bacterium]
MIPLVAAALAGTIEGRVVDVTGAPVAGVNVIAYDRRFRFENVGTDADGRYRIEDLAPELYRVRFIPPDASLSQEIWGGDTLASCDATLHEVGTDTSVTVDAAVPDGRVITGQIFRRDHSPLGFGEVEALPTWYREVGVASRRASTDADGFFELRGLPRFRTLPDTVLVKVRPGAVPEQYHLGAWSEDVAGPIEAVEDLTDLGPFSVREGVTLSGVVTGPQGPVEAAEVHVFAGRYTNVTLTDADGAWSIDALTPGEMLIWATAPGLGRTYWPGIDRPPLERLVVDVEGAVRADIDLEMPAEGRVTGTFVTSGDATLGSLLFVNDDGSVGLAAGVAEDGTFAIGGLQPGTWSVEAYGAKLDIVEGPLRVDGVPLVVEVVAGDEVSLGRIEPPEAARIEGRITEPSTGAPVYGAALILENTEDGSRRIDFTNREGEYVLRAIPPGAWSLQAAYSPFCLTDGGYVSVYWPQHVNPSVSGTVELSAGEVFTWDALMPRDADLDEMGDDWELANGLDPTIDDSQEDPDGDGFSNLLEYRLGTDPQEVYDRGCSCAGSRVAFVIWPVWLGFWGRRRR